MTDKFKKYLENERLSFLLLFLWFVIMVWVSLFLLKGIYSCKDLYYINGDASVSAAHFIKVCQIKQTIGNVIFFINFAFPALIGFIVSQGVLNILPDSSGQALFIAGFIPTAILQTWYLSRIISRRINQKYVNT